MMKPIDLIEHPEGGRFREVFRSPHVVTKHDGSQRSALTHIYFSLKASEVSCFHKVSSDEVWNLYQGAGLDLYLWDGSATPPQRIRLAAAENCYCHVVPAGLWQAAVPLDDTVLVGCSVGPGFDFADFMMLRHNTPEASQLLSSAPNLTRCIAPAADPA